VDRLPLEPEDWLVTAELFSEAECPGTWELLGARRCRLAAIFHDAIPLKHPQITWPQSVSRHPEYMKMLAGFDRVFAVSQASRDELIGFWSWQGVAVKAQVETIVLGADFLPKRKMTPEASPPPRTEAELPSVLCVGIIEPRKNQLFLLGVCERLWASGLRFQLHLVGRVNPHFGAPIVERIKTLQRSWPYLKFHDAAEDELLAQLYATARVTVFPTLAEGCGLPLLESIWMGVPCLCSDLAVLRENTAGGGCETATLNDSVGWERALGRILTDNVYWGSLRAAALARTHPTWAATAAQLLRALS
jgi:glycosyltransferase involved in cell wall biosynthesis